MFRQSTKDITKLPPQCGIELGDSLMYAYADHLMNGGMGIDPFNTETHAIMEASCMGLKNLLVGVMMIPSEGCPEKNLCQQMAVVHRYMTKLNDDVMKEIHDQLKKDKQIKLKYG